MSCMFDNKEVAARHLPVAHGPASRDSRGDRCSQDARVSRKAKVDGANERQVEVRRPSETRLHASVVVDRKRDDGDPYADVPCTD